MGLDSVSDFLTQIEQYVRGGAIVGQGRPVYLIQATQPAAVHPEDSHLPLGDRFEEVRVAIQPGEQVVVVEDVMARMFTASGYDAVTNTCTLKQLYESFILPVIRYGQAYPGLLYRYVLTFDKRNPLFGLKDEERQRRQEATAKSAARAEEDPNKVKAPTYPQGSVLEEQGVRTTSGELLPLNTASMMKCSHIRRAVLEYLVQRLMADIRLNGMRVTVDWLHEHAPFHRDLGAARYTTDPKLKNQIEEGDVAVWATAHMYRHYHVIVRSVDSDIVAIGMLQVQKFQKSVCVVLDGKWSTTLIPGTAPDIMQQWKDREANRTVCLSRLAYLARKQYGKQWRRLLFSLVAAAIMCGTDFIHKASAAPVLSKDTIFHVWVQYYQQPQQRVFHSYREFAKAFLLVYTVQYATPIWDIVGDVTFTGAVKDKQQASIKALIQWLKQGRTLAIDTVWSVRKQDKKEGWRGLPDPSGMYTSWFRCARNLQYWVTLQGTWPCAFEFTSTVPVCPADLIEYTRKLKVTQADIWFLQSMIQAV